MLRCSLLVALVAGLAGCLGEAPHDNPLDPLSDEFRDEGTVEGRVTGIYPPFEGRPGVRLRLVPLEGGAEVMTTTGADGAFRVSRLPSGPYAVWAEGEGLRPDADTVTVEVGGTAEVDLPVDALPVVTSQAARTVHIERWFPETPLFRLEVEAQATDPDRATDVDGVALVVPDLGFRVPLAEVGPGRYASTFDGDALPEGQVQALLGRALYVEATDVTGNTGVGPPLALVRVIEQTPLTARPQGLEVVSENPPVLEWRPASLPFAFTYRVDVSLVDGAGVPNLVESASALAPATTTYAVRQPLPSGDYVWTVWVTDGAGNRSRSKEAGFRVP